MMTTKRWVALIVAIAIALFAITVPKKEANLAFEDIFNEEGMTEEIVEPGSPTKKIVKLTIDGGIMSGGSSSLFGGEGYDHEFFLNQLQTAYEDPDVKGLFLEVNSPGGGVYESAEIARLIKQIQQDKKIPFYVSMKNMAASGGYYVAASADKIFATEETITGSIGVIMSNLNISELLDKLGIKDATVKSGDLKDMGSTNRPWTDKDREVLQTMVDNSYNRFVKIVADGRDMPEDKVREIADGRIYDGQQAVENGLVDALAFPEDALEEMKKEKTLKGASVISYETSASAWEKAFPFKIMNNWIKGFSSKNKLTPLGLPSLSEETPQLMYWYGGSAIHE